MKLQRSIPLFSFSLSSASSAWSLFSSLSIPDPSFSPKAGFPYLPIVPASLQPQLVHSSITAVPNLVQNPQWSTSSSIHQLWALGPGSNSQTGREPLIGSVAHLGMSCSKAGDPPWLSHFHCHPGRGDWGQWVHQARWGALPGDRHRISI